MSLSLASLEQAMLPVRCGGLGIRSATALAPSAFLASLSASDDLVSRLLPVRNRQLPDSLADEASRCWHSLGGTTAPPRECAHIQRKWDEQVCSSKIATLVQAADIRGKARLLGVQATGSGSWLHALPSIAIGLRLSDEEVRIAVGLRLGAPLVRTHSCICGTKVEVDGHHGLSCRRSAGRHLRHSLANDAIARAFRSVDVPVELEPPGLFRGDGKRPDGATLIPWSQGRCLIWDFTCPDTLAQSHLLQSSLAAGSAASVAETNKISKYSGLATIYRFAPFAIETLGGWGPDAISLSSELGGRIAAKTGEPRSTNFFRQRLDVVIQRGNAASIRGTMVDSARQDDVGSDT